MYPGYNLNGQVGQPTNPVGYNPWAAQAQAQLAAAQMQQNALYAQQIQQQQAAQLGQGQIGQIGQLGHIAAASLQHGNPSQMVQNSYRPQGHSAPIGPATYQQRNHFNNNRFRGGYNNQRRGRGFKRGYGQMRKPRVPRYSRTCELCKVLTNSEEQWQLHIIGKRHVKAQKAQDAQNQHIMSNASISSTTGTKALTLGPASMPSDEFVVEIDGTRKCALCDVEFSSASVEMMHIQGKRHKMAVKTGIPQPHPNARNKVKQQALGCCDLCGVDFTSECQKQSHMIGKRHLENCRKVARGQPPKKKQKVSYWASMGQQVPTKLIPNTVLNAPSTVKGVKSEDKKPLALNCLQNFVKAADLKSVKAEASVKAETNSTVTSKSSKPNTNGTSKSSNPVIKTDHTAHAVVPGTAATHYVNPARLQQSGSTSGTSEMKRNPFMNDKVENTKQAQVAQPVAGNQLNQGQAEHEVLQKEVERIYAQYKALAEGNNVAGAQKVYLEYQQAYDRYIVSYNAFAARVQAPGA